MDVRKLIFAAAVLVGMHLDVACAADAVFPLREVPGAGPGLVTQLQVDGLPSMSGAVYGGLTMAAMKKEQVTVSGLQGDPFALPNPGSYAIRVVTSVPAITLFGDTQATYYGLIIVEKGNAPVGTTIYVGNGDTTRENIACQATVDASGVARCALRTPHAQFIDLNKGDTYWILVAAPSASPSQQFTISLMHAETGPGVIATGPGIVKAGVTQVVRLGFPDWADVVFRHQSYVNDYVPDASPVYGLIFIGDDSSQVLIPIALTNRSIVNDVPTALELPLAANIFTPLSTKFVLQPHEAMRHLFFDISPNLGTGLPIYTPYLPVKVRTTANFDSVYMAYADVAPQTRSAGVSPAPTVVHQAPRNDDGSFELTDIHNGRWYVVVTNDSDVPKEFAVSLSIDQPPQTTLPQNLGAPSNPTIAPGTYYNPQRSGHGVSISQAGGQQLLFWYTYLEDGTPSWYQAQAPSPGVVSGWWKAPLYRASWNGGKTRLTDVGSVVLTPIDSNKFVFTWSLDGQTGSEVFSPLARFGDCPVFNGAVTNLNGAWYAPTLSGYGMDVLALPEQQFDLFYFYDSVGIARWGVGDSLPFQPASSLAFRQNSGFCPTCTYTPVTWQSMGSIDVTYNDAASGHLSTNLVLQPPLNGTWTFDRPMSRLTGQQACTK